MERMGNKAMATRPKTGGRQKGTPNKATREIKEIAQEYTLTAIRALAEIAENGDSDAARVSAANALLDRAYGKPRAALEHSGPDGLSLSVPSLVIMPFEKE